MSIGSIYETAYKGDFNQVKVKLDQDEALAKTPDTNGRLLLHWAALGGNEYLVDYLIDCGSPVNAVDDTNSTALILASSAGKYEVVRLLIGRGANVNNKTNRGQSSLHYACSKGHYEHFGIDHWRRRNAERNQANIAKILVENDANVNESDILSATPLHRAAAQGRNNIVELLLMFPQTRVNLCDSTGSTPLHLACEEDRQAAACMLVKAGADLRTQNKEKKTSLDLCSPKLKQTLSALTD